MVMLLVRFLGLAIAAGGAFVAYRGMEAVDEIRRQEMEVFQLQSHMAGKQISKEVGEKKVAESQKHMEANTTDRNVRLTIAVGALILGFGMLFFPSPRKRKVRKVEPMQAPFGEPPAPAGQ